MTGAFESPFDPERGFNKGIRRRRADMSSWVDDPGEIQSLKTRLSQWVDRNIPSEYHCRLRYEVNPMGRDEWVMVVVHYEPETETA